MNETHTQLTINHLLQDLQYMVRCMMRMYLQMFQNIWWVGHAQAQHRSLRDLLHQFPEQRWQVSADVPAIRTRILAGQPDLTDTLCKTRQR